MKRIAIYFVILLASLTLVATACGDDKSTSDSADASTDAKSNADTNNNADADSNTDADADADANANADSDADADISNNPDADDNHPTSPQPVNLGTAGDYVILAKSGVSTTGATAIVGDIGLSPADATYLTGFDLLNPPTTFSESALVTGKLWAADYDAPTPSNLTTAVQDMETAYTDAAGRTLPDFTELGAGNIDGLTLVPGLYKWGTGVSIPTGVIFDGGANDVWILQIGQDFTVGNGAIVTLTGGAQAKNIFWQVAGQTTIGTTAAVHGILLCQTLIEFNTGATLSGRALAQTAVTLDATAITAPNN